MLQSSQSLMKTMSGIVWTDWCSPDYSTNRHCIPGILIVECYMVIVAVGNIVGQVARESQMEQVNQEPPGGYFSWILL